MQWDFLIPSFFSDSDYGIMEYISLYAIDAIEFFSCNHLASKVSTPATPTRSSF